MDPRDEGRTNNEHEVEQWLDAAICQYSKVEPRTGLENRVLANLQAERGRTAMQRRWWWTAGTVAVAAAIVAAAWVGGNGNRKTPVAAVETSTTQREDAGRSKEPGPRLPATQQAKAGTRRPRVEPAIGDVAEVKPPKLEQFPSPAPLTEQEEMLARYVQEFPRRATLVARAQTEHRKQDEREMAAPWPANDASGLEQQE